MKTASFVKLSSGNIEATIDGKTGFLSPRTLAIPVGSSIVFRCDRPKDDFELSLYEFEIEVEGVVVAGNADVIARKFMTDLFFLSNGAAGEVTEAALLALIQSVDGYDPDVPKALIVENGALILLPVQINEL